MRKCLCAILAMACSAGAVDWKAYRPQGCLSDFAGVSDFTTKTQIEEYCAGVQKATGRQIFLVTISSLEGEPVEDVGRTILDGWRDPKKQATMVLLSIANRRHWATPEVSRAVTREMGPALRQSNYGEALRAAASAMGEAAARAANVHLATQLPRRIRPSAWDSIGWLAIVGAVVIAALLFWAGTPKGYGHLLRRSTFGSRGSGGFGGYDSGDSQGGFGGNTCPDW